MQIYVKPCPATPPSEFEDVSSDDDEPQGAVGGFERSPINTRSRTRAAAEKSTWPQQEEEEQYSNSDEWSDDDDGDNKIGLGTTTLLPVFKKQWKMVYC